ncbi:MAG TPA: hypothetical protein VLW50_04505 [Streptosporangiaceae bacterium]|nr:hypothetical protein [Streptosporangiaceae bacterium]
MTATRVWNGTVAGTAIEVDFADRYEYVQVTNLAVEGVADVLFFTAELRRRRSSAFTCFSFALSLFLMVMRRSQFARHLYLPLLIGLERESGRCGQRPVTDFAHRHWQLPAILRARSG